MMKVEQHDFEQLARLAPLACDPQIPDAVFNKKAGTDCTCAAGNSIPPAPRRAPPSRPLPPTGANAGADQATFAAALATVAPSPPEPIARPRGLCPATARQPDLADVVLGAPLLSERRQLKYAEARLKLEAAATMLTQVAALGGSLGLKVFGAVADASQSVQQAQEALQLLATPALCPIEDEGLVFQFLQGG